MKKNLTFLMISILLVSTIVLAAPLFKVKTTAKIQTGQDFVPGQILVKFRNGADNSKINNSFGCATIDENIKGGFKYISIPADKTVEEMVAVYSTDPNVIYAEPNYIYRSYMVPNDPYYVYQWHMPMINMEQAWDQNTGSGVIVAILDVGVAYENYGIYAQAPDLAQTNFVTGYDFINNDTHPNDDNGHGTHVCGTIAQSTNNNLGVTGIAYNCSIMPVKVLDAGGSGATDVIANGIYYAADNGAKVINMSLGSSSFSTTMNNACNYAKALGVTIICAAGNSGKEILEYPAANTACVSVSSVRLDSTLVKYSTYNDSVDIAAPGGDVTVDQDSDGYIDGVLQQTHDGSNFTTFSYYFYQGTSMASPHVAGVAALIISAAGGSITPDEVQTILENSAVDLGTAGWDNKFGYGLLDANAAIQLVTPNNDPPVANFSGTPTSGFAPLNVNFTDLSSNAPTSWSWTFGDGATSTLKNPSHTYNNVGTYNVTLTATNANGSDVETKTSYITASELPVGGTMNVYDIVVTRVRSGGRNYFGRGVVTIYDSYNQPLSNATVYVTATGPTSGTYSGITGADGKVTFNTASTRTITTEWCFEVTNVTHASNTYDAGSNVVTKSCEGGDVFSDGTEVEFALPGNFGLNQNYPNPFNPTTEISFTLPQTSFVTLEVFNINGQTVEVLASGSFKAGNHTITWDAPEKPSGVYFYRLTADKNVDTKKMILMK